MQGVRRKLNASGYTTDVVGTMLLSRRLSSIKQYDSHVKAWELFCETKNVSSTFTSVPLVLEFLQQLVAKNYSYSTLNTAKSAVAACVTLNSELALGSHPDIKMFLKGVFNGNPPKTRHTEIWDSDKVIDWLKTTGVAKDCSTDLLVKKLALLILLVTGQRPQVLQALRISAMSHNEDSVSFILQCSDVKQGRPGYSPPVVLLSQYPDKTVCVFEHLLHYLIRTKECRGSVDELFLTVKKPIHKASLNTLSRWIKSCLPEAGINVEIYGAGSVRSASASKASSKGIPIDVLLKTAGWARESTFGRFYHKPITKPENLAKFVLN